MATVVLCACSTSRVVEMDAGADVVDEVRAASLELGEPVRLGRTHGRTAVDEWQITSAGGTLVAAVSLNGELFVRRFASSGEVIDPAPILIDSGATLLAVAGSRGGEFVVTWKEATARRVNHSFFRGGSFETVTTATRSDLNERVLTSRLQDDGVQVWVVSCERIPLEPYVCVIVRRETRRDGTSFEEVVVPEYSTAFTNPAPQVLPIVARATMEGTGGVVQWLPGDPPVVRAQWLDAEGRLSGSHFDLGTYDVESIARGVFGDPIAVAVREDGAALLTSTELVIFSNDGSVIDERTLPYRGVDVVANSTGYTTLLRADDAWWVEVVSMDDVAVCELGSEVSHHGALAAGSPPTAAWLESGDSVTMKTVRTDECEAIRDSWVLPPMWPARGSVRTRWLSHSGLAVYDGGVGDHTLRALDGDGAPVGEPVALPMLRAIPFLATDSTFWIRAHEMLAIGSDLSERGRAPLTADYVWTPGGGGFGIDTRIEGGAEMEVREYDSDLRLLDTRRASGSGYAFDLTADDGRLILVSHSDTVSVLDPAAPEPHLAEASVGEIRAAIACGMGCWLVRTRAGLVRVDWRAGRLTVTPIFDIQPRIWAHNEDYLLLADEERLRIHDRLGAPLGELELAILGIRAIDVSAVDAERFALSYEADDGEGGRATYTRMVRVVPRL